MNFLFLCPLLLYKQNYRAVAGSNIWTHANTKPIKLTTTPISSLNEGEAYFFRVRAFTRWGRGPPSLPIGPVAMRDRGASRHPLGKYTTMILCIKVTCLEQRFASD